MKHVLRSRAGFTMVEMILFIGILGIMSGTLTSVYIATQDARVEQQYVSEVEQRGTLLLGTITKYVRRAEAMIKSPVGQSGSILVLQMAENAEYPTIVLSTSTGRILLAQKTSVFQLLNERVTATGFTVTNIGGTTLHVRFDLKTTIPTLKKTQYLKHFESTITLFPDDQLAGGGCTTCPAPTCTNKVYQWYQCVTSACSLSPVTMPC